ncbi:Transposon TX1 uncharacterized 149 kDa protein [Stylophora pistillata]|uniref:Transposon TX1 uncharacterized 149 kDa protein n=1 Tax=Stylophora pistillata TaxID=50429 RepID=A0A2B4SEL3_STYPI|nr:Transposon TX1 uncharacterized 149 kDa protein [Stylophora pistillata]
MVMPGGLCPQEPMLPPPAADFPPISARNAATPSVNVVSAPIPSITIEDNTVDAPNVADGKDLVEDLTISETIITVINEASSEANNKVNNEVNNEISNEISAECISKQPEASVKEVNNNPGQSTSQLMNESNSTIVENKDEDITEFSSQDSTSVQGSESPVLSEFPSPLVRSVSSDNFQTVTRKRPDPLAQASLLSNLSSSLSLDQARECEGLLSAEECFEALKGIAKNKTPSVDGFQAEFYLRFWDVLGREPVSVLNACFHSGSLPLSLRRWVIILAFKKSDRLDPRKWRPITLLNVDYKMASRAIAGRLLRVIHLVVSKDPTCGVPGRFIGENVALVPDVAHYTMSTGTPAAILSLDQEKAFDLVDWGFMTATLSAMGFGPSFIACVRLFYRRVQSTVHVNGYLSPFFDLSRGVRQGCPLSPLPYVLVSEVLAANIRANSRISGLSLPGYPPLSPISQYADDTSLVLSSDEAIMAVFEVYALFELASGAKLNQGKSKGLWLGQWVGRTDPPVDLDWSPSRLKILGVFVGRGELEEATKFGPTRKSQQPDR